MKAAILCGGVWPRGETDRQLTWPFYPNLLLKTQSQLRIEAGVRYRLSLAY